MNLTLSWDLFIIVFFALVIAYSFIIGKKQSMTIILSSYIAIVAVEALGNVAERLFGFSESQSMLSSFGIPLDASVTSVIKLVLFISIVIYLTVRAGLHVEHSKDSGAVIGIVLTALCGVATAGLLLATLLTFISGAAILDMHITATPGLEVVLKQSELMKLMIENLDLGFLFPACVLIVAGWWNN